MDSKQNLIEFTFTHHEYILTLSLECLLKDNLVSASTSVDANKDTEIDPTIANMFSNLRGKHTNPKIELFASSRSINMNWNIVL